VVLTQGRSRFPRSVIEQLPRLRFIAQTGRTTSHLDVAACTERGILVATAGANASPAVAELTWGLIIAALRHLPQEIGRMKQGAWQSTVGTGLQGKTLGLYGFDAVASTVGAVGRAFGMQVLCWEGQEPGGKAREAGFDAPASREALFENADVVSLHIALGKETRGSITAADLARMKPTALIVNAMRAPLIADGALVEALKRGRPGHAAVDVYEEEPVVGGNHPLLGLPNAVCSPHLGNVEWGVLEKLYAGAVDGILGFAAGKPVNVINPEALGK
jgi:D-3-phosphoglycerate dehydrogenase